MMISSRFVSPLLTVLIMLNHAIVVAYSFSFSCSRRQQQQKQSLQPPRGFLLLREHESTRLFSTESSSSSTPSSPSSYDPEEEMKRQLAKAKEILAKSKAKLEEKEKKMEEEKEKEKAGPVPFFASKQKPLSDPDQRRDRVIKAKDEKTGLVTADGEKMAAMSEEEEWEFRSLLEVFENEMDENEDVYSEASQQLAERDVAASIWNLRKQMKTEDYLKIFDKKNRFIGEDN